MPLAWDDRCMVCVCVCRYMCVHSVLALREVLSA